MFTMARVRSNGKCIGRLSNAEVVNDSGRELPKVPPKHCESVYWFVLCSTVDKGI